MLSFCFYAFAIIVRKLDSFYVGAPWCASTSTKLIQTKIKRSGILHGFETLVQGNELVGGSRVSKSDEGRK